MNYNFILDLLFVKLNKSFDQIRFRIYIFRVDGLIDTIILIE